jgi:ABC-type multidrug transport system ATPase subunit
MQLDGVAYRYRRKAPWVLRDVGLTLPRERIVEVRGRNGSGKTTLLRVIAGILGPTQGKITGRPERIGFSPERFPSAQPFTVARYLTHMARMRQLPNAKALIDDWAERLFLTSLLDVPLAELSKGSAHKVGLAQSLMSGAGLLVLDEPFSGLDTRTRKRLPDILTDLAADGATVVLSDHGAELREHKEVDRWRVGDGKVTTITAAEAAAADVDRPLRSIIEVAVDPDEAETLVRRLRRRGYDVSDPRPEPQLERTRE